MFPFRNHILLYYWHNFNLLIFYLFFISAPNFIINLPSFCFHATSFVHCVQINSGEVNICYFILPQILWLSVVCRVKLKILIVWNKASKPKLADQQNALFSLWWRGLCVPVFCRKHFRTSPSEGGFSVRVLLVMQSLKSCNLLLNLAITYKIKCCMTLSWTVTESILL